MARTWRWVGEVAVWLLLALTMHRSSAAPLTACSGSAGPRLSVPLGITQQTNLCPTGCEEAVASLLALHHANVHDPVVVGNSTVRMLRGTHSCHGLNFTLPYLLDTRGESTATLLAFYRHFVRLDVPVVVGGTRSAIVAPLASSAAAFDMLTVTDTSTATSLSRPDAYPLLVRLTPGDSWIGQAIVSFAQHMEWGAVAVLTIADVYGASIAEAVSTSGADRGVRVAHSGVYVGGDQRSMASALGLVKASGAKVIVTAVYTVDVERLYAAAASHGMLGEGYVYVVTDTVVDPFQGATDPATLRQRMAGTVRIVPGAAAGEEAAAWERFAAMWRAADGTVPLPAEWGLPGDYFATTAPTAPAARSYDAVWASALAVAGVVDAAGGTLSHPANVTGSALFTTLVNQTFNFTGASGGVRFTPEGERYTVDPLFTVAYMALSGSTAAWRDVGSAGISGVVLSEPIVWAGNTTQVPLDGLSCPPRHDYVDGATRCVPFMGLVAGRAEPGQPPWSVSRQQVLAAALLAVDHANRRDTTVLDAFGALVPDFYVQPVRVNSQGQANVLVRETMALMSGTTGVASHPKSGVVSFVGYLSSEVTRAMGPVASALAVPVESVFSTSSSLNDKSSHPYTTRAVIPDSVTAVAVAQTMYQLGWRRVAVMASNNDYGAAFMQDFASAALDMGITLGLAQLYEKGNAAHARLTVRNLHASGARIILLVTSSEEEAIFLEAEALGMIGLGYAWFITDGIERDVIQEAADPTHMAQIMDRFVRLLPGPRATTEMERFAALFKAQRADSAYWQQLQEQAGIVPSERLTQATFDTPMAVSTGFTFDAVAQNLVAVNATWETRSSGDGAAMLAAVRDADFPGVTGQVRLDRTTWDRDPSTVAVIMESWVFNASTGLLDLEIVGSWTGSTTAMVLDGDNKPIVRWPGGTAQTPHDGLCPSPGDFFHPTRLQCEACPAGTHLDLASVSCRPCPLGTFAPEPGLASCISCDTVGGYANTTGASTCHLCPLFSARGLDTPAVSVSECQCVPGSYHPLGAVGEPCLACPDGAVCDGGSAVPVAEAGHWRFDSHHFTFLACDNHEACMGAPGDSLTRANDGLNSSSHYQQGCAVGYTGTLCAQCASGYGIAGTNRCGRCLELVPAILVLIACVILVSIGVSYLMSNAIRGQGKVTYFTTIKKIVLSHMQVMGIFVSLDLDWGPSVLTLLTAQDAATSLGANVMSVDCLLQHMTNDNVFAKQQLVKALLPLLVIVLVLCTWFLLYQCMLCMGAGSADTRRVTPSHAATAAARPPRASAAEAAVDAFRRGSADHASPATANVQVDVDMDPETKAGAAKEGGGSGGIVGKLEQKRAALERKIDANIVALEQKYERGVDTVVTLGGRHLAGLDPTRMLRMEGLGSGLAGRVQLCLILIFFTVYPFLTKQTFTLFRCRGFKSTVLSALGAGPSALATTEYQRVGGDLNVACSDTAWLHWMLGVGLPMLLLYVVGVPAAFFVLLRKRVWLGGLKHGEPVPLRSRILLGFLFDGYHARFYWWEIMIMVRKVAFVAIAIFVTEQPETQVTAIMLAVSVSLVLHMTAHPYSHEMSDHTESAALIVQMFTLVAGLVFLPGAAVSAGVKIAATVLILVLNVGFVVAAAAAVSITKKRSAKIKRVIARLTPEYIRQRSLMARAGRAMRHSVHDLRKSTAPYPRQPGSSHGNAASGDVASPSLVHPHQRLVSPASTRDASPAAAAGCSSIGVRDDAVLPIGSGVGVGSSGSLPAQTVGGPAQRDEPTDNEFDSDRAGVDGNSSTEPGQM